MDIHITGVPQATNHVELKLFLTESANRCDIIAFNVYKRKNLNWATFTSPSEAKARAFLARHGGNAPREPLFFKTQLLHFKKSKYNPDKLSVNSLERKDTEMREKRSKEPAKPKPSHSSINFISLHAGVWEYNSEGRLVFDEKHSEIPRGPHGGRSAPKSNKIAFGRHALAIMLEQVLPESTRPVRIDISYDTLEHVVVSNDMDDRGTLIMTLRSPPKIYSILQDSDPFAIPQNGDLITMILARLSLKNKMPRMVRETSLWPQLGKNTALCMVYRFILPDVHTANFIMDHINHTSTMPNALSFRIMNPSWPTKCIDMEYRTLSNLLDVRQSDSLAYFTFSVRFQLLALVLEGTLSPRTIAKLIPWVTAICQHYQSDPERVARGVQMLQSQIPTPGPYVEGDEFGIKSIFERIQTNIIECSEFESNHMRPSHLILTYQATVTPTGLLLRGPGTSIANRILRRYVDRSEYFLRVSFADEDGTPIRWDPRASLENIYRRFYKIVLEGVEIAGRVFTFLGFSHSSLREHTAWFMAPFTPVGSQVEISSKDVIEDLGDFSHIRCSAKCAARIGQAFSDTIYAMPILEGAFVDEQWPDIERNGRCFSDGCGLISKELLEHVWSRLPYQKRQKRPTILQIRYRGAKGIVALDSTLPGKQLLVRKSMTKYTAKVTWKDLEICDANYHPLRAFLNQQYIKILEDLGVPLENFMGMQQNALDKLALAVDHPISAAEFLETSRSGSAARMSSLFTNLYYIGLSFKTDKFLTDIVEVAIMTAVRDMKYRARIPIEQGHLLFGVVDHTNELKEGEVYVTTTTDYDGCGLRKKTIVVKDQLVVSRSPALHPGDIQVVRGVNVSASSPLHDLNNCIVFSQQGQRDLPSQLSGGDLDGDTYLIIEDPRLLPSRRYVPADYPPTVAKDLGRSVQVGDIAEFFIDFMKADRLGQICNMHKVRADKFDEGTAHSDCILLAGFASDAVDFSKSGNAVDIKRVPKGKDFIRPDWMAPGPVFVIDKEGAAVLEEDDADDPDDPDAISALDPEKTALRYYRSDKALGRLYRAINQTEVLSEIRKGFEPFQRTRMGGEPSLLMALENYLDRETQHIEWKHHRRFATEIREYYEENLFEIMQSYRMPREKPLTELEIFSGNILAKKERAASRYVRETNTEIRNRFDQDVWNITRRMVVGDWSDDDGEDGVQAEALPRAMACFKVSLETHGWPRNHGGMYLKSWKYVAASVCLEQLKLYHGRLNPII